MIKPALWGRRHIASLELPREKSLLHCGPSPEKHHVLMCVFYLINGAGDRKEPQEHGYPPNPCFVGYAVNAQYRNPPCP